jgi:hypothetical protein
MKKVKIKSDTLVLPAQNQFSLLNLLYHPIILKNTILFIAQNLALQKINTLNPRKLYPQQKVAIATAINAIQYFLKKEKNKITPHNLQKINAKLQKINIPHYFQNIKPITPTLLKILLLNYYQQTIEALQIKDNDKRIKKSIFFLTTYKQTQKLKNFISTVPLYTPFLFQSPPLFPKIQFLLLKPNTLFQILYNHPAENLFHYQYKFRKINTFHHIDNEKLFYLANIVFLYKIFLFTDQQIQKILQIPKKNYNQILQQKELFLKYNHVQKLINQMLAFLLQENIPPHLLLFFSEQNKNTHLNNYLYQNPFLQQNSQPQNLKNL